MNMSIFPQYLIQKDYVLFNLFHYICLFPQFTVERILVNLPHLANKLLFEASKFDECDHWSPIDFLLTSKLFLLRFCISDVVFFLKVDAGDV